MSSRRVRDSAALPRAYAREWRRRTPLRHSRRVAQETGHTCIWSPWGDSLLPPARLGERQVDFRPVSENVAAKRVQQKLANGGYLLSVQCTARICDIKWPNPSVARPVPLSILELVAPAVPTCPSSGQRFRPGYRHAVVIPRVVPERHVGAATPRVRGSACGMPLFRRASTATPRLDGAILGLKVGRNLS